MQLFVWILLSFTLVLQALAFSSESLCFYGGEFVLNEVKATSRAECLFGNIRASGTIKDGTLVCQYPALSAEQIRVVINLDEEKIDLGIIPVESCVQLFNDQGCPSDFPQVRIELDRVEAAQNDFLCVWNGISTEVSKEGTTLVCPIPHHPATLNWRLHLKTQDRRGHVAMTQELLNFQYDNCQDQIPEILALESTLNPWSKQISMSISPNSRRNVWENSNKPLCKFTIGKSVHQDIGKILDDGTFWCPTPVLPVGESMLEISVDGRTWSKPRIIYTESGIEGFYPPEACSGQKLKIRTNPPLESTIEYTCYFGSQPIKGTLNDDLTLLCEIPKGEDQVELGVLVHDRKMNRATSFVIGVFQHNNC